MGDRRRRMRVPLRVDVKMRGRGSLCYALDISVGGVCLQTTELCQVRERVCLHFHIGAERMEVWAVAEVKWCRNAEARGLRFHEIGLEFLRLSGGGASAIARLVDGCDLPARKMNAVAS